MLTNKAINHYPYYEDKSYLNNVSAEKATPIGKYLTSDSFTSKEITGDDSAITFEKGELTGRFEMGSTIVLIFEADNNTNLNIEPGQKLWLGEQIVS